MKREYVIFGLLLLTPLVTLAVTVVNQGIGTAFWIWLAAFATLGIGLWALVRWHARNHRYGCPECRHEFAITTFTDLTSAHYPDHKSLVCPRCGMRSWCVESGLDKRVSPDR
ncbi:MAG: hypothetical protein ABIE70_08920 [bacterium]